jgi:hypothetical protein
MSPILARPKQYRQAREFGQFLDSTRRRSLAEEVVKYREQRCRFPAGFQPGLRRESPGATPSEAARKPFFVTFQVA